MQAMVLRNAGAPLERSEIETPVPGAGEVLVRVIASGVNPLDLKIRAGAAAHARVSLPAVPGIDLAGVVAGVGTGVTAFAVGDEVYGMTGGVGGLPGSLAQFVAVDAALLAPKPRRLGFVEAAALPLAGITAWEGLVDRAGVTSGDTVLVHGGAGGVGHVAVQLARARGARVFATGSAASLDVIRALGAEPIDYRTTGVEQYVRSATGGAGFDIVFDTVGGETLDRSFAAVRSYTGRVVSILGWGTHSLAPLSFRGASYSGVFSLLPLLDGVGRAHHGAVLRQLAALVDAGSITPIVHPTAFDLDSVEDAHRAQVSGARGKIVVAVDPSYLERAT